MSSGCRSLRLCTVLALAAALELLSAPHAQAFDIALKDVAPDRIERQRAFNFGLTTLPGTPDVDKLDQRLAAKGVVAGAQILIRIFKVESELEVWMRNGERFLLLATYPICHWSGTIGPKTREGDKQAPEGIYSVALKQTRLVGQWRRAFNVGFPNPLDQQQSRTGSNILVHGGCSSVGCFAMTNPVMDEIFRLMQAAFKAGQERVQVHIFPFRMTVENLDQHKDSPWIQGWRDLKIGHDLFQATGVPPHVGVCDRRYVFRDGRIDLDWDPYQVVPTSTAPGPDGSRCSGDDPLKVVATSADNPTRTAAVSTLGATPLVTGSLPPPAVVPIAARLIPPPPEMTSTASPRITAPPPTPVKASTTEHAEEHRKPALTTPPPALRVRAVAAPTAAVPPTAVRRAEGIDRKRVRSRAIATRASTDINDRPEFIAVRKSAP